MESNEFLFSPESQRRKKYFKLLFQNSKKGKKKKKNHRQTLETLPRRTHLSVFYLIHSCSHDNSGRRRVRGEK